MLKTFVTILCIMALAIFAITLCYNLDIKIKPNIVNAITENLVSHVGNIKVKIFYQQNTDIEDNRTKLQNKINNWLEEYSSRIEVIDTDISVSIYNHMGITVSENSTAMITYKAIN